MVQLERAEIDYVNNSKKYMLTKEDLATDCFQHQFYHVYRARVTAMRDRVVKNAIRMLGNDLNITTLENVAEYEGKKVLIVGTLEKRISARPSVLKELAADEHLITEVDEDQCLVSTSDFLEFEDEKQIVKVSGNIQMDDVATGCTVGLYGKTVKSDLFEVEQVVWPQLAPQRPWPKHDSDVFVAFLSGIDLCGNAVTDSNTVASFSLFSRWVCGELDLDYAEPANVQRVVIAGESISVGSQSREFANAARYLTRNEAGPNVTCVQQLDTLLGRLTAQMSVDLMSGQGDPAPALMPQQPIHKACLPIAGCNGGMLTLAPNPYEFSVGECDVAALSGQSVSDLRRLSSVSSGCDLLSLILKWQHLAPTCPDTVDGFPFVDRDPLVLDRTLPHVLVAGNQPKAEMRMHEMSGGKKTLLLCLPKFSKSNTVALLNLRTMEVRFKAFYV